MYFPSPAEGVLRQGEVVSGVIQIHVRAQSLIGEGGELELEEREHPYALILTQDCDLDWDYKARIAPPLDPGLNQDAKTKEENKRQAKLVPNVLLCELTPLESMRPRLAGGSEVFRRIRDNRDERYQCLLEVPAASDLGRTGLPELVADFKRVFAIPTDELYLRLGLGVKRRALLDSPFLQHLSSRFGYYCLRVALPENAMPELTAGNAEPLALPSATTQG